MTDTNVATIQNKQPIVVMRERLEERRGELKKALPSDINPDHFIRALTTSAQINPDLQACSWPSLWLAALKACRDGLLPDGREGAIVPYKSQAQWIPMTFGLIKRFRQSGECHWITADVVRQGETFEHWIDQGGEHFRHVPGDDDTMPIIKVYGAALTKDGAFSCAVLSMNEINKIKNESRATREDAPWKKWPTEMMKKTALRRLAKLLPSGRDIVDDDTDATEAPTLAPLTPYGEQLQRQRPASAADALNQFANAPQVGGPHPDNLAGGHGGGGSSDPPPNASDDAAAVSSDDIDAAYQHGKQAKLDGFKRGALPGEYRDEEHQREAIAWQAGFDGKDKPEWSV